MTDLLQVKDLEVGKKYMVFQVGTDTSLNLARGRLMLVATGEFIKTKDGDAIIKKERDERGLAPVGYYGDNYVFEAVEPVPPEGAAGTGFRAARLLKPRGGRRKTRKSKRRQRKTRRSRK